MKDEQVINLFELQMTLGKTAASMLRDIDGNKYLNGVYQYVTVNGTQYKISLYKEKE